MPAASLLVMSNIGPENTILPVKVEISTEISYCNSQSLAGTRRHTPNEDA